MNPTRRRWTDAVDDLTEKLLAECHSTPWPTAPQQARARADAMRALSPPLTSASATAWRAASISSGVGGFRFSNCMVHLSREAGRAAPWACRYDR